MRKIGRILGQRIKGEKSEVLTKFMISDSSPHPALKHYFTLEGEDSDAFYRMSFSPNGGLLAIPSENGNVYVIDIVTGQIIYHFKHPFPVICTSWSPDSRMLALGFHDIGKKIYIYDMTKGLLIQILENHNSGIMDIAWSPDGKFLASCSNDHTIIIWDTETLRWDTETLRPIDEINAHSHQVYSIAWSPDSTHICSGSWDGRICLFNVITGKIKWQENDQGYINSVDWSSSGKYIASASNNQTICIWDPKSGRKQIVLEGHTADIIDVKFLHNDNFIASLNQKGTFIIWQTDTWEEVMRIDKIGETTILANIAFSKTKPIMASLGSSIREIYLWDVDFKLIQLAEPNTKTVHYVNAKAVLLGDSGVGKSGLGFRIAEGKFRKTQSTHGAQFWHFSTEKLPNLPPGIQAELTLWDLAGQPEYRLIHQLFVDDTDAALLLFDCSDPADPFCGVPYWAKVLKKHAPSHAKKFLVSARCDVSPITVDSRGIYEIMGKYGFDEYYKTSAMIGEGVDSLFQSLLKNIPWDQLPKTSTPRLFQAVREFLLDQKSKRKTLIDMYEIKNEIVKCNSDLSVSQDELDTVVHLLQSRGLVYRLNPKPGILFILLKPELINQYGSSIITAARNHPLGIGAVLERDVLTGTFTISGFDRLPYNEETFVLEATTELLIRHDLCFREMGYLIFPSQINVTPFTPAITQPRAEVAYYFSGSIETIYASLVVRLIYTDYFHREDQWKWAVEFSRNGFRLGFSMQQIEEGTGELEIYFDPNISEVDRILFIRFITDHLKAKGIDIQEQIRLYCPQCSKEVTNRDAIEVRVREGHLDIPCQYCTTTILIPKSIEERYNRDPSFSKKQQQLTETVERRTVAEVEQFRADKEQYSHIETSIIHILHISDLHLETEFQAQQYRVQLESDLIHELNIKRLEYLVISGDITTKATEEEFKVAFAFVDSIVKRFGLDPSRVIVVPGNHDLNWDISEDAYQFLPQRRLVLPLQEGQYIPAGEAGALVRNDEIYQKRFCNFNNFYRRIYNSKEYPFDYENQVHFVENPEDSILIIGLNSCWQIDHYFQDRSMINTSALNQVIDRLQDGTYDNWLKIAVWHHPVSGKEMMDNEFLQLLTIHKFQVCMHGHIHEAIEGYHKYDDNRGINIIGAGTFGAPAREQTVGIPLQYNIMYYDPLKNKITVHSRKKEQSNGGWCADARWGDKNNPKSYYHIQIKK